MSFLKNIKMYLATIFLAIRPLVISVRGIFNWLP